MRLGLENRRELLFAVVLAVFAALGIWHWTRSQSLASSAVADSAPVKADQVAAAQARQKDLALDPTLRFELLKNSEGKDYDSGRRNIFSPESKLAGIEKPVCNGTIKDCTPSRVDCKKNPRDLACAPPPPPGPNCAVTPNDPRCPPPAIALKFYGFASRPGETKKIFLSDGDDVFIGAEGDIVDRHYRIVKISPTSVEVEDVLNNVKQTLPLLQG